MEAKKKRLTLDLDPPVQRRLKAIAALKGVSVRRYCLTAIGNEMDRDEANDVSGRGFDRNCSDLRGSEGLKGENWGRIPVADAQDDGYQTAFAQFDPPSLNSYG